MKARVEFALLLALGLLGSGCSPPPPDMQALWARRMAHGADTVGFPDVLNRIRSARDVRAYLAKAGHPRSPNASPSFGPVAYPIYEQLVLNDAEKDMLREHFSERSRWRGADGLMWCINPPPPETYVVRFVDRNGPIDVSFTFPLQVACFPIPDGTAKHTSSAAAGFERWRPFLTRHSAIPNYASLFPSEPAPVPARTIPVSMPLESATRSRSPH